jgi:hypothetical protein
MSAMLTYLQDPEIILMGDAVDAAIALTGATVRRRSRCSVPLMASLGAPICGFHAPGPGSEIADVMPTCFLLVRRWAANGKVALA